MSSISFFDEFLEAEKAGIRLRYGKHYEAGAFLARLDFIGQIYKFDPALAAEKMKGYALLVGMNVLIDALARETTFIDDLVGAIGEDQKGLSRESTYDVAYHDALLEILRTLSSTGTDRDLNDVCPSVHEVIEAYLKQFPNARYDSTEAQVKRWLKKTGYKTSPKGTRFTS